VWRLDRLGRSLKDLIALVETLEAKGIDLKSLK
jgi:DNA invertase Pin-like site-specific DNA recombinase